MNKLMKDWSLMKRLIWLHALRGSSPSWVWQLLTGTAPLTLLDAVAHPLHSLTQYGKCVQDGTPTPDAPVDIVTNNGALRYGALGSNLLDPSAANTILGYYIRKEDGVEKDAASNFMFAGYMPVEPGKTYVAYGRAKTGDDLADYNRVAWYDENKSWLSGANYTQNRIAVVTAPENAAYARFSCNPSGSTTVTVTQEIVDSYNWMFAEGTEEIVPFVPFEGGIYTDGEADVLTVRGQNLVDLNAVTDGYYYDPSGVLVEAAVARLTDYIPVRAGQKYTLYVKAAQIGVSANVRCNLFNSVQEWMAQSAFVVNSGAEAVSTITPTENGFLRVSANYTGTGAKVDWSTLQIVRGEYTLATMPPYEPYHAPQTVNDVPMLLSVGDVKDEADLVSGHADRAITVFRVSPDLNWLLASGTGYKQFYTSDTQGKLANSVSCMSNVAPYGCTASNRASYQFGCYTGGTGNLCFQMIGEASLSTVDAWKEFLRTNGVYVVAAKATATTEQTTPHALHTSAGTNVVDVTAAVEGVGLAVEYAKSGSAALAQEPEETP